MINNLKVKYKRFYSLDELKEVKRALINELVTVYKKSRFLRKL